MIVFDLDGTLANCSHRLHLIRDKSHQDWDNFHAQAKYDEPIAEAVYLLKLMIQFQRVEIWTGRSDAFKQDTVKWLGEAGIFGVSDLRMRAAKDHRPDYVIKEEWLEKSIYRPNLVFEDRTRVVEMYRRNGIPCYQVGPGDY